MSGSDLFVTAVQTGISSRGIAALMAMSKATVARTLEEVDRDVLGLDGKRYRAHPWTDDDRRAAVAIVHHYAHEGLSLRKIVAEMKTIGITISIGTAHSYLTTWTCTACSGGQSETPEHADADDALVGDVA